MISAGSFYVLALAVGHPQEATEISGSFEGVLPCADCPGIAYRVDLFPDRAYYLRTRYLEKSDGTFDDIGSWALSSDGSTLALKGGREAPLLFAWTDGGRALTELDLEGRPIESTQNHDRSRRGSDSLGSGSRSRRVHLHGRFPVFECLTGREASRGHGGGLHLPRASVHGKRAEPDGALAA
jgi:hypothetical protein